jgi:4-aminobutyrate aminotransferase
MDAPHFKTEIPGPRAKALIERDRRSTSPSYTRPYPFVMAGGSGAVVEDVDGNRFLDCAAGIAVNTTGHSHPDVVAAIVDQAKRFLHMCSTDFYYEAEVRLAEEMQQIAPLDGEIRTFFSNSGTEAVEGAIKLAKYRTGRQNLIAFLGAFHGRTTGAVTLTASKVTYRRGFGPLMPGVYHVPYAYCYRCPLNLRVDDCQAECAGLIETQLFVHLVAPDEVAAIIVEPIQGEGGYIVPPQKFIDRLQDIAKRYSILLIADEVQSGMGRTGRMFAIEHYGVRPDIITLAKGVASGLPLGIMSAGGGVMTWPPGVHGSTFGGNPLSCQAALVTIQLLRETLVANAARIGDRLLEGLRGMADRHPLIGEIRGKGLMIGVELIRDVRTKERATQEREAVLEECFKRGVLMLGAGPNSIRLSPPLVLTESQADTVLQVLDESLAIVEQRARS